MHFKFSSYGVSSCCVNLKYRVESATTITSQRLVCSGSPILSFYPGTHLFSNVALVLHRYTCSILVHLSILYLPNYTCMVSRPKIQPCNQTEPIKIKHENSQKQICTGACARTQTHPTIDEQTVKQSNHRIQYP